MRELTVQLGTRAYAVKIGNNMLGALSSDCVVSEILGDRKLFLVSDEAVWSLYGATLEKGLSGRNIVGRALIKPGEANKNLDSLKSVWDSMVDSEVGREGCVIAFGGGVVGDLAGFAAASYQRGIDFIQVPTTILAMVDSSVGGKTGIDHPRGKNLIGAFHQPKAVAIDLDVLATLPEREILSGLAEVIKAGLIGDPELFDLLAKHGPEIVSDAETMAEAISRSLELKARVVEQDEREGGARALLNLGHTLGHAVEAATGYDVYTHGEAVAIGLVFIVRLSAKLGMLNGEEAEKILTMLKHWGYPLRASGVDVEKILEGFKFDKKNKNGVPMWVLLRGIGQAEYGIAVEEGIVRGLLRQTQKEQL